MSAAPAVGVPLCSDDRSAGPPVGREWPEKSCGTASEVMLGRNEANHGAPSGETCSTRRFRRTARLHSFPPRMSTVPRRPALTPDLNELRGFCVAAELG